MLTYVSSNSGVLSQGHIKENKHAVGLACKHLGMRPSISSLEYAMEMLFNLCVPRHIELNGFLFANSARGLWTLGCC